MTQTIKADIVIIGGGIAGLWTLNHLQKLGFKNTILLEKNALGSGQTLKSQGVIHGGLKYSLNGILSNDTQAIEDMPNIWQQSLNGTLNNKSNIKYVNLQDAKILATSQYLFSTNTLAAKISNFFTSHLLQSKTDKANTDELPQILKHKDFTGNIYKLNEMILDIKSVLLALANNYYNNLIKIDNTQTEIIITPDIAENHQNNNGYAESITVGINNEPHKIYAKCFVFTSGEHNNNLVKPYIDVPMQLRPLQMVFVSHNNLTKLYGHNIDGSMLPNMTISTHYNKNNDVVWYLGGKIAETGIDRTSAEQIKCAKNELATIFPYLDLTNATWGSFFINRAEAQTANNKKPESATSFIHNNVITAWPTKLALTPLLAKQIEEYVNKLGLKSDNIDTSFDYSKYPKPSVGEYPWDEACNIITK